MKIGFFPGDSKTRRWGREIHPWASMATDALKDNGCSIQFLTASDIRRFSLPADVDLVHLNWPQSLTHPNKPKLRKYMPFSLYRKWFVRHVDRAVRKMEQSTIPIVWQVHDLPHDTDPRYQELLTYVFRKFYAVADGLLFYEASAQQPVYNLFGPPGDRIVGIAHLGDYCGIHGQPVTKEEARRRLGIPLSKRLFLYPGRVRSSRNPAEFTKCFIEVSSDDDLLYVAGHGTWRIEASFSHERVLVEDGLTEHERFRDLVCASDFVVNDAYRYLGSAVIRVAMGYGVPVISYRFGCTADIARGAYIEILDLPGGVRKALMEAMTISRDAYRRMSQEALERHRERPWAAYAKGCRSLYETLLDQKDG